MTLLQLINGMSILALVLVIFIIVIIVLSRFNKL